MKKSVKIILVATALVIVLAIISAIVYCCCFRNNLTRGTETNTDQSAILVESPFNAASWQTFTGGNTGLEFQFPAGWFIDTNTGWDIHLANTSWNEEACGDDYLGMEIQILEDAKYSAGKFEAFASSFRTSLEMAPAENLMTSLTVAGHAAYRFEHSGWDSHCSGAGYLIEKNGSLNNSVGKMEKLD
jgi:hypothetical protein